MVDLLQLPPNYTKGGTSLMKSVVNMYGQRAASGIIVGEKVILGTEAKAKRCPRR